MRARKGILFREVDEAPREGVRILFIIEEGPDTKDWTTLYKLGHFQKDPSAFAGGNFLETVVSEGDYQEDDQVEIVETYSAENVMAWGYLPEVNEKSFSEL